MAETQTNQINNNSNVGKTIPIKVSVITTIRDGNPAIELRRGTTNRQIMNAIISAAFHNQPIIIQPEFTDRLQSLNSLVKKGIIYKEPKDNKYYFLFDN